MADKIVDMPRASFLEDGSIVEMEFKTDSGKSIPLSFALENFEQFVSRAVQLVTGARNQKLAIGDHLEIHPVPAEVAAAETAVGGSKVILSIRSNTGLPYNFALTPEEAEGLCPQLLKAAKSAKKQASQSRH